MRLLEIFNENKTTIIFALAALAIVILYIAIKHYVENVIPKKRLNSNNPDKSIRVVKRITEQYVRRNDGRAIYSVEVGSSKTKGSADIILVGYFGVLVIVTCDLSGSIYANDKDEMLTQLSGGERRSHENPFINVKNAAKAVSELLREKRVFRVPVEAAVVFTGKKASVNVPRSLDGFTPKELTKILKTDRFLDDKKVDIDMTVNAILGMSKR